MALLHFKAQYEIRTSCGKRIGKSTSDISSVTCPVCLEKIAVNREANRDLGKFDIQDDQIVTGDGRRARIRRNETILRMQDGQTMRMKLDGLQDVVRRVVSEDKADRAFCEEVSRVLGHSIVAEGSASDVATEALELLDALEISGRTVGLEFKTAVMVRALGHRNAAVRAFATRVAPVKLIEGSIVDRSYEVVVEAAKRLPSYAARRALRRFSNDDLLESIRDAKILKEDGIKQPKLVPLELKIYDEERLGDAVKQQGKDDDLSDLWYEMQATKLLQDYGRKIEMNWEEVAVRALCSNNKVTSGVEIDEKKLLKALKDKIEERDDAHLERDELKESIDWLAVHDDGLLEGYIDASDESVDPVEALLENNGSASDVLSESCRVFGVDINNPTTGKLPSLNGLRRIDELALERLCTSYEAKNPRRRLTWSPANLIDDQIVFRVSKK